MPKTKPLIAEEINSCLAKKYYTPSELAEIFGISLSQLTKLRMNGKGPKYIKVGPKSIHYAPSEVLKYIERCTRQSTSE